MIGQEQKAPSDSPQNDRCVNSTSGESEDEDLLKESAVTSDWILNKRGVYEDEKQKRAPITTIITPVAQRKETK